MSLGKKYIWAKYDPLITRLLNLQVELSEEALFVTLLFLLLFPCATCKAVPYCAATKTLCKGRQPTEKDPRYYVKTDNGDDRQKPFRNSV